MSTEALRRLERERDLYRGLLHLNRGSELEPFIREALSLVVRVVDAEQGYLELFAPEGREEERPWWTAAGCSAEEIQQIRDVVSRGIIAEALGTGEVIMTPSALLDPRFRDLKSVRRSSIRAVLCAPIGRDPPLGVLYLQRRSLMEMFSEEDRVCAEIAVEQLAPLVQSLFERRRFDSRRDDTAPFRQRMKLDGLVGASPALAELLREVELVAPLEVCVLLTGDTGSGKSQVARVLHANSPRSSGPFVEINCAALPENLMESELFGAMAGAHSTAARKVDGKVTAAHHGTLFLDEIAELSTKAQAKLLQLLQTKEYYPLGAAHPVRADVRVIAATNIDLDRAVADKRFREDLLYRLRVFPIRVPSISERREDIPLLSRHFAETAQRTHKLRRTPLSPGALRALSVAEWPGNVRELAHRVEAAAIRASAAVSEQIEATHLGLDAPAERSDEKIAVTFHDGTRRYQRELLAATLEATDGNVAEAARRLDLTRGHVYTLMNTLGLNRR